MAVARAFGVTHQLNLSESDVTNIARALQRKAAEAVEEQRRVETEKAVADAAAAKAAAEERARLAAVSRERSILEPSDLVCTRTSAIKLPV